MIIKEPPMQDQNLRRNPWYKTSVQTLKIEQKELMTDQINNTTDNAVEVHHETTIIPKISPHRTDTVLLLEIKIIMAEALLLKVISVP